MQLFVERARDMTCVRSTGSSSGGLATGASGLAEDRLQFPEHTQGGAGALRPRGRLMCQFDFGGTTRISGIGSVHNRVVDFDLKQHRSYRQEAGILTSRKPAVGPYVVETSVGASTERRGVLFTLTCGESVEGESEGRTVLLSIQS